jgi:hypothetical protein
MGFQDFAYDKTDKGAKNTYAFLRENADIVCLQFGADCPWQEAYDGEPFPQVLQDKMKERRDGVGADTRIYLEISPLDMGRAAMGGTNMDDFEDKPFDDPMVKQAYLAYARGMVEFFEPAFLCIGIEVNELAGNSPQLWPGYVELHKYIYATLKEEHPDLPVFATMTLHNMLAEKSKGNEERLEQLRALLPYNDVAGISFYPFLGDHRDPDAPTKNFNWIRNFVGDLPIAITETAYPAESLSLETWDINIPASPADQVDYLQTVFNMAERDEYLFVINFAYRDYDIWWEKEKDKWDDWVKAWKDTGILDGQGVPRPSFELWQHYFTKQYVRESRDLAKRDKGKAIGGFNVDQAQTYGILTMDPDKAAAEGWSVNGLWAGFGMPEAVRGVTHLLTPGDEYPAKWSYPTMKDYVEESHEAGVLVPGTILGIGEFVLLHKRFPEILLGTCRLADGSTAHYSEDRLFMCSNNPIYDEVMITVGNEAIDAGVDLIVFDEIQGNELTLYWPNSTGYCDHCLAAYRAHLGSKYSVKELAEQFGIDDLTTADFVALLGPQGGKPWAETDTLFKELWNMQKRNSFERGSRIVAALRAHMKEVGHVIPICANTTEMGLQNFTGIRLSAVQWGSVVDFASFENSHKELLPQGKWLAAERLAVASFPSPPTVLIRYDPLHAMELDYLAGKSNRSVYLYGLLAESYANGCGFVSYHQEKGLPAAVGLWKETFAAQRFILENRDLFNPRAETGAKVAVLYIENEGQRYRCNSYMGLAQALAESNIPFDVLIDGGDGIVPVTLTENKLKPYELVVLPHALYLTQAQRDSLNTFVEDGGTVLTADPGEFDIAEAAQVRNVGAGRYVAFPEIRQGESTSRDLGGEYFAEYDDAVRVLIADSVNKYADSVLQVLGEDRSVCVYTRYDTSPERLVIHLVNSDYDPDGNVMRRKENLQVRVKRPAFYDTVRPARIYSPDVAGTSPVECPVTIADDFIELSVAELDVYSIVVL